jgi:hypothetical protein
MGWDGEVELEREEGGSSDLNDTTPSHPIQESKSG